MDIDFEKGYIASCDMQEFDIAWLTWLNEIKDGTGPYYRIHMEDARRTQFLKGYLQGMEDV